jgi:anion-transporting  ArsA/GET3 family ATPase
MDQASSAALEKTTSLAEVLERSRIIITVGSGGVGKTTISAALALRASVAQRSSLVCTIDPAKRLANALGLDALGNHEARIDDARIAAANITPGAPLWAMMLDMKHAWDKLIDDHAPPEKREKILNNRFYQTLSTVLAGSQEYIAMEKLYALHTENRHSLIVLDTPPTVHALDFLNAPNRLLEFFDNDAAKWLLTPALAAGKFGLKILNFGSSSVAKTLSRFTGTETLQQLADFMLNISGMNDGFRERARATKALLRDPSTAFVLVTGPMPERIEEALYFHSVLASQGMRTAAIVVNQVHPPVDEAVRREALGISDSVLKAKVLETIDEHATLAESDSRGIERLTQRTSPTPLVLVPRLSTDVHELRGLFDTSAFLVGERRI